MRPASITASDETVRLINSIPTMELAVAKSTANSIISSMTFKKGSTSKVRLERDISMAKRSEEVCRIVYFTVLAGEGLRTTNSTWTR